ncbi:MAG: hypothetical protein RL477_1580, partial [Pseudomonadota bacterium]
MTLRAAASAALIAGLCLSGIAQPAAAQDASRLAGQYLAIQAGSSWLGSSSHTATGINGEAEFRNGSVGALALGHGYGNGFRSEIEYSQRKNEADNVNGTAAAGSMGANSLMLNGLYDFSAGGTFIPYIGAGVGMTRVRSGVGPVGGSSVKDHDLDYAWQTMIGVALPLQDNLALTA